VSSFVYGFFFVAMFPKVKVALSKLRVFIKIKQYFVDFFSTFELQNPKECSKRALVTSSKVYVVKKRRFAYGNSLLFQVQTNNNFFA
jgi:hypothetical protein